MPEIAREHTPIGLPQAAAAMVAALRARDPSVTFETACYLLALVWNETGGGASMNNYNWGNIAGEYHGNFFRPSWYANENSPLHAQMLAGKVPSKFRSYTSATEGLQDYVAVLYKQFPSVVKAAATGDAFTFASAVYKSRYCPDDGCRPEKMSASYASLARKVSTQPVIASLPKDRAVSSNLEPVEGSSSGSPPSAPLGSGSSSGKIDGKDNLPELRRGNRGPAVALWQALLGIVPVDGKFGTVTERETLSYQKSHSYAGSPLVADGVVGDLSWLSVIEILRRQQLIT